MRIDEAIIRKAVEMLRQAAPKATIILFGSHARRDANNDSDLDFLVVEPEVASRREEMVRLRDVLRPLRIPVDILVISESAFEEWRTLPDTLIHDAATEGTVFHAAA